MTVTAAGVLLKADDTGRVLLVQRAEDNHNEQAAGKWEVPGGGVDGDETPVQAAKREFSEETGVKFPKKAKLAGSWTTDNGYECFVFVIKHEAKVKINVDPDEVEAAAWWDPRDMPGNPAIRLELQSADWALIGSAKKQLIAINDGDSPVAPGDHVAVFDLDGTISAAPLQMCALMSGLRSQGWRVAVLTGTGDGIAADPAGLKAKEAKLRAFGCEDCWDELVLFDATNAALAKQKAAWCAAHGVQIMVDNTRRNTKAATKVGVAVALVPWATRS